MNSLQSALFDAQQPADDFDMDMLPPPQMDDFDMLNYDGPEDIVGEKRVREISMVLRRESNLWNDVSATR